jgi:hypothetical protein
VGGCWGCFVPGEQSFGVLPGAENPDGTGPHEPRRDSMRLMVRRGSGVRVPTSALAASASRRAQRQRFTFPAACEDHDHLYHGPRVNNQVPPR